MEWERFSGQYISGEQAKLGKWTIFQIFYDACTSKDYEEKYKLKCSLPGIKDVIGHFKEVEGAKEKAESVFKYWLDNSGLKK